MLKRPIRYHSLHRKSKDTKNEGNNTTTLNTTAGCTISNPSYKLIICLILSLSLCSCLPDLPWKYKNDFSRQLLHILVQLNDDKYDKLKKIKVQFFKL